MILVVNVFNNVSNTLFYRTKIPPGKIPNPLIRFLPFLKSEKNSTKILLIAVVVSNEAKGRISKRR